MIRLTEGDLPRYVFESFADDSMVHGVFTRLGGSSQGAYATLNVGHTVGDEPSRVEANHQAIYRALGTGPENVVTAHQVHGNRAAVVWVAWVRKEDASSVSTASAGLVSRSGVPGRS